jgi:hypothetical protein
VPNHVQDGQFLLLCDQVRLGKLLRDCHGDQVQELHTLPLWNPLSLWIPHKLWVRLCLTEWVNLPH